MQDVVVPPSLARRQRRHLAQRVANDGPPAVAAGLQAEEALCRNQNLGHQLHGVCTGRGDEEAMGRARRSPRRQRIEC